MVEKQFSIGKRRGQGGIQALSGAAWGLGLFAITLVVVLAVLDTLATTQTTDSAAQNAAESILTDVASLGDWTPIIVVVIAAVVILGLMGYLGGARRNKA
jgi:hypothetical protein